MTFVPWLAGQVGMNLGSQTANSLKQLTPRHANSIYVWVTWSALRGEGHGKGGLKKLQKTGS